MNIDLDSMTVEDYALLLVAMAEDDHITVVDVLDRYTEGGLKGRHWLNFWLALAQADEQIEAGKAALREAQMAVAAAKTFGQPARVSGQTFMTGD